MEYLKLEQFIREMPLYHEIAFKLCNLENEKSRGPMTKEAKLYFSELFHRKKIRLKCIECNAECPFDVKCTFSSLYSNCNSVEIHGLGVGSTYCVKIDAASLLDESAHFNDDEGIINYSFQCTMNPRHQCKMYFLYTIKSNAMSLIKIGQYPINMALMNSRSNEFKRVLNKYRAFEDYRFYERSISNDLLIGACTYLRRILEKMVIFKLNDETIDQAQKQKADTFDKKIRLVKHLFDEEIQETLKSSHVLLSKGIHELNNEDISEFYSLILKVIDIQLESELEELEKNERRKNLLRGINDSVEKFKK